MVGGIKALIADRVCNLSVFNLKCSTSNTVSIVWALMWFKLIRVFFWPSQPVLYSLLFRVQTCCVVFFQSSLGTTNMAAHRNSALTLMALHQTGLSCSRRRLSVSHTPLTFLINECSARGLQMWTDSAPTSVVALRPFRSAQGWPSGWDDLGR